MFVASITDPIVEVATDVVAELGLLGIFVLMVLESACIPVPSEATMLFAGFNVSDGEYSLFAAVAVGSVANLVGSWIAYAVGWYGRVDILEKHGKKLHIKKSHLHGRTAGSSATATRPSSSPGCSRSSAPSSRFPPGWPGCRSGASAS